MTNGLLIYGEKFAHFLIYWEPLLHIWLCTQSHLNFLIWGKLCFLFYQCIFFCHLGWEGNGGRVLNLLKVAVNSLCCVDRAIVGRSKCCYTLNRKFVTNIPRNENCATSFPFSAFMYLWGATLIFPRSVSLFCCIAFADRSWEYI